MDRKDGYLRVAEKAAHYLLPMQCMKGENAGCFFYPFWKGDADYTNSRWQEAVLTLSWLWKVKKRPFRDRVAAGIDFWCGIQNSDGSFPECCRGERSFSATAFSTLAVAESADIIGGRDDWQDHLVKSGRWLLRNDERVMTNQEAAAATALMKLFRVFDDDRFLKGYEKKLSVVIGNQTKDGHYREKGGCDIGYSSLTLEMLGRCHLLDKRDEILESARSFIMFFNGAGDAKNVRGTDWVIPDGFEYFAKDIPDARHSIKKIFQRKPDDFVHIRDERHLCTDAYRHCWAFENVCFDMDVRPFSLAKPTKLPPKEARFRLLRKRGLHRFRRLRYFR
jgi:hypothetical protein